MRMCIASCHNVFMGPISDRVKLYKYFSKRCVDAEEKLVFMKNHDHASYVCVVLGPLVDATLVPQYLHHLVFSAKHGWHAQNRPHTYPIIHAYAFKPKRVHQILRSGNPVAMQKCFQSLITTHLAQLHLAEDDSDSSDASKSQEDGSSSGSDSGSDSEQEKGAGYPNDEEVCAVEEEQESEEVEEEEEEVEEEEEKKAKKDKKASSKTNGKNDKKDKKDKKDRKGKQGTKRKQPDQPDDQDDCVIRPADQKPVKFSKQKTPKKTPTKPAAGKQYS